MYLVKHIWCTSFYPCLQNFKPEGLCWNNFLCLALKPESKVTKVVPISIYYIQQQNFQLTSLSYFLYKFSNSSPQQSANPGASLGQNNDHSPLFWTLCMNRSGTHNAQKRSLARCSSCQITIQICTAQNLEGINLILLET